MDYDVSSRYSWTCFVRKRLIIEEGGEVPRLVAVEGEVDADGRYELLNFSLFQNH